MEGQEGSGAKGADRGQDTVVGFNGFLSHGEVDGGAIVLKAGGIEQRPLTAMLRPAGVTARVVFLWYDLSELMKLAS